MTDEPNWVERRWALESALKTKPLELWHTIRGALQDACESFTQHYSTGERGAVCALENGHRIRISTTYRALHGSGHTGVQSYVLIVFVADPPAIDIARDDRPTKRLPFTVNTEGTLLIDNQNLTSDALSKQILEPLLFPKPPQ